MSECTKGTWEVLKWELDALEPRVLVVTHAEGGTSCIAECQWRPGSPEQDVGNARLIVAACNACKAVNPDNPIAAAEALPELVEALEDLLDDHGKINSVFDMVDRVGGVLAEATGKEA